MSWEAIKALMFAAGLGGWLASEVNRSIEAGLIEDSPNIVLRASFEQQAGSIAISPDGKVLASGESGAIRLWDIDTGKQRLTLKPHRGGGSFDIAFSPDGKLLASDGGDGTLRLWNLAAGKEIFTFKGNTYAFFGPAGNCLAFSPDGKLLASSGELGLRLWNPSNGKSIATFPDLGGPLAFGPDSKTLAVGNCLIDAATGKTKIQMPLPDREFPTCVAISSDGKLVAGGGWAGIARIWDAATGKERTQIVLGENCIYCLAFSHDCRMLAVGSAGWVKLFDARTGRELATRQGHRGLFGTTMAFTPDGQSLATCDEYSISLWDISRVDRR